MLIDGNLLARKTHPELASYFGGSPVSLELKMHDPEFEGLEDIANDASLVRFASAIAAAACKHYPIAVTPPTLKLISDIGGESFQCIDG